MKFNTFRTKRPTKSMDLVQFHLLSLSDNVPSYQVTGMMMRKAVRSTFHLATITSCTSSPFSGKFCSPVSPPPRSGTDGPVSSCPSPSSASSPPSSGTWRHTSAAPWGSGTR